MFQTCEAGTTAALFREGCTANEVDPGNGEERWYEQSGYVKFSIVDLPIFDQHPVYQGCYCHGSCDGASKEDLIVDEEICNDFQLEVAELNPLECFYQVQI